MKRGRFFLPPDMFFQGIAEVVIHLDDPGRKAKVFKEEFPGVVGAEMNMRQQGIRIDPRSLTGVLHLLEIRRGTDCFRGDSRRHRRDLVIIETEPETDSFGGEGRPKLSGQDYSLVRDKMNPYPLHQVEEVLFTGIGNHAGLHLQASGIGPCEKIQILVLAFDLMDSFPLFPLELHHLPVVMPFPFSSRPGPGSNSFTRRCFEIVTRPIPG